MKLTTSQAKLITSARRQQRIQRIGAWVVVLAWPVWTYFASQGAVPRPELPVATFLFLLAVPYLRRPPVDARVLDVLVELVDDDEALGRNA